VVRADVRIEGERIAAVGDLQPAPGDLIVEGEELVVAPGFIDIHSHADEDIFDRPEAEAAVSQGITTVVVGMDGDSPLPLGAQVDLPGAVDSVRSLDRGHTRGPITLRCPCRCRPGAAPEAVA
jgi:N-acyl-D-aspartate/D-glutamate deacylase